MVNKIPKHVALANMARFLDEAGLPYFLDGGTLLGLIRDLKLIPWDTDVDLSMDSTTAQKLLQLINDKRVPFKMSARTFSPRLDSRPELWRSLKYENPNVRVFKCNVSGVPVDIIVRYTDGVYHYCSLWNRTRRVRSDIITPYKSMRFPIGVFSVPARPHEFLASIYGPNWKTPDKNWKCKDNDRSIR